MNAEKQRLLLAGIKVINNFCKTNDIVLPETKVLKPGDRDYRLGSCAYYRNGKITIMPSKCAHPGNGIRSWSWPGNTVDRTPYGVMAHETGHHVDLTNRGLLKNCPYEKPLTGYHGTGDNWTKDGKETDHEDFAEKLRLFITNPDLLKHIRPATYQYLIKFGLKPVERRGWKRVLKSAPKGIVRAARNKVKRA